MYTNIALKNFELIEQEKDHQSLRHYFMKTNQLSAHIDLFNNMSQHNCLNAAFDNVMYCIDNNTYFD